MTTGSSEVTCPIDAVDDVLLYNSKLVLKNEASGYEELSDVYDGAVKTFTKVDVFEEIFGDPEDCAAKFVFRLPPDLTKKAILTLIKYIHQGLSKGNPRE